MIKRVFLILLVIIIGSAEADALKTDVLSSKQAGIVPIAAFSASGDLEKLKTALNEGLDAGLTINEIKEVLVQMYAYAGFPRSLNAINTFMDVLKRRAEQGKKDVTGAEASPSLPANKSSLELGSEIRTRLTGSAAVADYAAFTPVIDEFLRAHLFGDIFGRDNLDFQSREIATISALAAIEGVNPQLKAHFNVGLNIGLNEEQLRNLITVIAAKVGKRRAENALQVLNDALRSRPTNQSSVSVRASSDSPLSKSIQITRNDEVQSQPAPAEHFTGSAQVRRLFQPIEPARATGGSVTFEPGARTAWHIHTLGQTLIVTAGTGWIQQWDDRVQEIRAGDVVWIPPGVKHWHGASAQKSMTHIAIQEQLDGKTVEWLEKVSDQQYLSGQRGSE